MGERSERTTCNDNNFIYNSTESYLLPQLYQISFDLGKIFRNHAIDACRSSDENVVHMHIDVHSYFCARIAFADCFYLRWLYNTIEVSEVSSSNFATRRP